ncbi:peroxisomal N(1)-acetyl-spermine/spermidine oxidase [Polypterus senegalus]|uniref:peroxisomal N(1)-acetyl-spermine/spermidine oxidase n=1 Tax=Polypterus senegalus TaxID=55291 RepID=UPI001963F04B|nr:peroxisomal N(1)-acetyl-spermine/spermidine oxidase [Polypterus senegalus]
MAMQAGLDAHIVIVGCGISGIGAALKLTQHGFKNVKILEASGRSGGRIKSTTFGNGIVEIGANWIHGPSKENPVFRLACEHKLLDDKSMSEENQAVDVGGHPPFLPVFYSSSGKRLGPEIVEPASQLFSSLLTKSHDFFGTETEPYPSVGEYVKKEIMHHAAQWKDDAETKRLKMAILSTMLKLECSICGSHSMDLVGLGSFGSYQTLPGIDCTFPGGYESLIHALMKGLPQGIVSYNTPVKCVHWNSSFRPAQPSELTYPVMVECENGEVVPADHVIVTASLGYLKQYFQTFLNPPLPLHKAHSIQRMGFGTNNKIFLEFEKPFWDPSCQVISLVWEDENSLYDATPDVKKFWVKKLFGFTVQHSDERLGHVLCGWIAGHESEYMEELSDAEVKESLTEVLRRFTGDSTITPKRVFRSKWHSDLYTRGSYSYVSVGCSMSDIDNIGQPLPLPGSNSRPFQVLFAGEATHPSFYSTTHGALLSGWREADRLISYFAPSVPETGSLNSKL